MTLELALPDPAKGPVPRGWSETALAEFEQVDDPDTLDKGRAVLSGYEAAWRAKGLDVREIRAALRFLEANIGRALGPHPGSGRKSPADDFGKDARYRFRSLAWPEQRYGLAVEAVRNGNLTAGAVLRYIAERHQADAGPLPTSEYGLIYADPPWRYENARGPGINREIERFYDSQSDDWIGALEVPAAADSVCFLWATNPLLPEALRVLAAWGFRYRTNLVWVKNKIGMGYYARQQHEMLLVGKRGALPVPSPKDRPSSVIHAARTAHSAKPPVVYELLEQMYPHIRKLELFARIARPGWDAWGNEVAA